jgi:hypothetical protein
MSPKGMRESTGLMVNYLYDLDDIEKNHEAFAQQCGDRGFGRAEEAGQGGSQGSGGRTRGAVALARGDRSELKTTD